jgi:putative nucleotidyltransferase with HDIG domain
MEPPAPTAHPSEGAAPAAGASARPPHGGRLRLRHLLFAALLLSGIIPLTVANLLLVERNREVLESQERQVLVTEARALSQEISGELETQRKQLAQLGHGLLAGEGEESATVRLHEPWVAGHLASAGFDSSDGLLSLRVLDVHGEGPRVNFRVLPESAQDALLTAFGRAVVGGRPAYELAARPGQGPLAAVAVPVARRFGTSQPLPRGGGPELVVEAVIELALPGAAPGPRRGRDTGEVSAALIDAGGRVLWTTGIPSGLERALAESWPVKDFATRPLSVIGQYAAEVEGEPREMLVQISPIEETGWGLVAQKPLASAFQAVDEIATTALWSTLLLILLALFFAIVTARRVSEPVQRLAETSHEIAAGNFGRRVAVGGLTVEFADLANDFNRMSGHVERYVEELQRAAAVNRDLFIGSLRSFAAAIDAKDPYTRGHSERVAAVSRTIARFLRLPEDVQHRVWIAALLHDVGKIGVDDRVLKKGGVLSAEEFELMKAHTVIGAEILAPIEQLREMIPAVRWHHENWNGRGYPDGLKGDQIPLIARIVAVADTFDAVTTERPYQRAYEPGEAVATIRRLVGSRFDAKVVTAFLGAWERGEVRVTPLRPRAVRSDAGGRPAAPAAAELGG